MSKPYECNDDLQSEEIVSAGYAVQISQSGNLRIAMAGISGRYPAIGVCVSGALSGENPRFVELGGLEFSSGMADFSGYLGQPIFLGRSGDVVSQAASGYIVQQIGMATASATMEVRIRQLFSSGCLSLGDFGAGVLLSAAIASGQIGQYHIASGLIASGHIGNAAVVSGSIASAAVGGMQIAPDAITSGRIAMTGTPDGTKVFRDDYSWAAPGAATINSGDIGSGKIQSGAVGGSLGPTPHIQSGTLGGFDHGSGGIIAGAVGSGAVVSANIASGQVGFGHLASGSVGSGSLASGQVTNLKLGSGAVTSSIIASGQIGQNHIGSGGIVSNAIASGQVGSFHIASAGVMSANIGSGQIGSAHLGFSTGGGALVSGSVQSGHVASGTIGGFVGPTRHIQSGTLAHTDFGSGAIQSGDIASGQIGSLHIASGAIITYAHNCLYDLAATAETISGVRCVKMNYSGLLIIAKAAVSGLWPAMGICFDNVLSGSIAQVVTFGNVVGPADQIGSGLCFSGRLGRPLFMGASGQVVTISGGGPRVGVGPTNSGAMTQRVGMSTTSGAMFVRIELELSSGAANLTTLTRWWPL